jgi:DNA-binding NarL/FixJ family response regulator
MSTEPRAERGAGPDALRSIASSIVTQRFARRGIAERSAPVRVVLADDHAVVRAGIQAVLARARDVTVVGTASSGEEVVPLTERLHPEVVVLDLDMPRGDGAAATRALCALERPPKVLILSMHTEEERLVPLLHDGASGYLSKDAADEELVDAIRVVAAGEVYVRPHVARLLAASARARDPEVDPLRRRYDALSPRERTVVQLMAEGYSGVEIGEHLGISHKTVDTYKQRIEEKLGITHRTEYVRLALALELIHK